MFICFLEVSPIFGQYSRRVVQWRGMNLTIEDIDSEERKSLDANDEIRNCQGDNIPVGNLRL